MPQTVRSLIALALVFFAVVFTASSGRGGPIAAGVLLVIGLPAIVALLRGAGGRSD